MGSFALLVDRRGSRLEVGANETLVVRQADGGCERIGLRALDQVVLFGEVELDSRVLRALAGAGVGLCCLPLRGSDEGALLLGPSTQAVAIRHAQHLACADRQQRLALARLTLRHKLAAMEAQRALWTQAGEDGQATGPHPLVLPGVLEAASDIETLMGIEGAATRTYFEHFRAALPAAFPFTQRRRRPPPDAANALMSLCYTLARTPAAQLVVGAGLDPQIGFLHGAQRERPALVLDLVEPARALLDGFVVELVSDGTLGASDFHLDPVQGVRLGLEGRRRFYARWFADGHARAKAPMRALLGDWLGLLRAKAGLPPADEAATDAWGGSE